MIDYVDRDKEIEKQLLEKFKKSKFFKYLKDLKLEIKSNIRRDEIHVEFMLKMGSRNYLPTLNRTLMDQHTIDEFLDNVRRRFVEHLFKVAENFGLKSEVIRRSEYEKMFCNFSRFIYANSSQKFITKSDIEKIAEHGTLNYFETDFMEDKQ